MINSEVKVKGLIAKLRTCADEKTTKRRKFPIDLFFCFFFNLRRPIIVDVKVGVVLRFKDDDEKSRRADE